MAHNSKQGFFSSLFKKKKQTEEEEAALLEAKFRLEERIREVLAERTEVPALLTVEEKQVALAIQEEEAEEAPVELLPISASVISIRKAPVPSFLHSNSEVQLPYAANSR